MTILIWEEYNDCVRLCLLIYFHRLNVFIHPIHIGFCRRILYIIIWYDIILYIKVQVNIKAHILCVVYSLRNVVHFRPARTYIRRKLISALLCVLYTAPCIHITPDQSTREDHILPSTTFRQYHNEWKTFRRRTSESYWIYIDGMHRIFSLSLPIHY